MPEQHCVCHLVEARIHALEHEVENWARLESPEPHTVDALTNALTERIRFVAIAASAAIEEENHQ